jgi:hypothetical protein
MNLSTCHIVSVGGWNAPHIETNNSAAAIYTVWKQWNLDVVARPGLENGFEGIDWDFEGNDNLVSPWNYLTTAVLNAGII